MVNYKFLNVTGLWDIILKDIDSNKILSLKQEKESFCPICYYPFISKNKIHCHHGIKDEISNVSFITGHFYETDYKGKPTNWFGQLLKNISEHPFKYPHTLLKIILEQKIVNSNWINNKIDFATMIPTNNQQTKLLFSEIAEELQLKWIPAEKLFIKNELRNYYSDRSEYVANKYTLKDNIKKEISYLIQNRDVLIFDDVFNQGFTFGRIINLLKKEDITRFRLAVIARTVPKKFRSTFSFP